MTPVEQILRDASRAVAGQRAGIAQHDAVTAADVLDALAVSPAFADELAARIGSEEAAEVQALLETAAGAPTKRFAL